MIDTTNKIEKTTKALIYLLIAVIVISFGFRDWDWSLPGAFMGKFAIYLFWLIALAGILNRFEIKNGWIGKIHYSLMRNRRYLGILMFFFVLAHYVWLQVFKYIKFGFPNKIPFYVTMGFYAFLMLIPMVVTSNNFSVKILKRFWKILHLLAYPVMILIILHTAFQNVDTNFLGMKIGLEYSLYYALPSFVILLLQLISHWYKINSKNKLNETKLYNFQIIAKEFDTPNSVKLTLKNIDPHLEVFTAKAGQHINLHFKIDGKDFNRSYSIFKQQGPKTIHLAIKKKENGIVSNYIIDKTQVGDVIQTSPAFGSFYDFNDTKNQTTAYLWTAGSGITPILNITSTICASYLNQVTIIDSNSTEKEIMLLPELKDLNQKYHSKLTISHHLTKQTETTDLKYTKGRINKEVISQIVANKDSIHYICGPDEFMESVFESLIQIGIKRENIHLEYFTIRQGENEKLFTAKDVVSISGEYLCIDCGYIKYFEVGQVFGSCPMCLSGEADDNHEFWKKV
ncbi:MAG: FAD-binding oxidoreductase [Patescibacteria group bacterium]